MTFKELYADLDHLLAVRTLIEDKRESIRMFESTPEDRALEQYELEQDPLVYPEDVDFILDEQQKKREISIDSLDKEIGSLKAELLQAFGGDKELASAFLECCPYSNRANINILTRKTLEYLSDNIPDEPINIEDIQNLIGGLGRDGSNLLEKYGHISEAEWENYISCPEDLEDYILKNRDLIDRFLEIPEIQVTVAHTFMEHGVDTNKVDQILAAPSYQDFTDGRDEDR